MKATTASDDDKVLVSRREWLRLTALAAGSAAGLAIGSGTASASPVADSDTFPFIAGWTAITSRLDLFTELTNGSKFQVAESMNLNIARWRNAANAWIAPPGQPPVRVTVGVQQLLLKDVLNGILGPIVGSLDNVFAAGLKAYGGYTGGGCPRLPQLVTIGSLGQYSGG